MNTGQQNLQSNLNRLFSFAWATKLSSINLNRKCRCGIVVTDVLELNYMKATGKCQMCDEFAGGVM